MKKLIGNQLKHLINSIEQMDVDAIRAFYNSLVEKKNENEKITSISTFNALVYIHFRKYYNEKCEEIFIKNFNRLLEGEISSSIFEDYVVLASCIETIDNDYINLAIHYIEENLENELTLDLLANQLHISKNYFSNLFKKVTGLRFCNYVNLRRIERAKHLLVDTKYPIDLIAQKCGYNSQSHFNTTFLSYEKTTPGTYRNKVS